MANTDWFTDTLREFGVAKPVTDFMGDSDVRIDGFGNVIPTHKPGGVHYLPYNWRKMGYRVATDKYLLFNYHQFPYREGYEVCLDWNHCYEDYKLNSVFLDSCGAGDGVIVVHPFTFTRMVASKYGVDKGLDALKMVMRDKINKRAKELF